MRCSRATVPLAGPVSGGFSLLELLFVLAVGALLLSLALPTYRDHVLAARRSLARAELMELQARQAQFFIDHKRYAGALTELGMPAASYEIDADGSRHPPGVAGSIYLFSLTGDARGYTLRARPRGDQTADVRCGALGLDHLGVRTAHGEGSMGECW